jgi:Uma2 family endonuclease
MPVSEQTFRQIALEEPNVWELHCGVLRRKPGMTAAHNDVTIQLVLQLGPQLDAREFRVRSNAGHVRRSAQNYYIPDVFVVPMELVRQLLPQQEVLEAYEDPLPLVVEVWSRSTGDFDVEEKLPEYQRRGDLEIWRIHPYERTLTAWRRQPDGSYTETVYTGGIVHPVALPGVAIEFDALFA